MFSRLFGWLLSTKSTLPTHVDDRLTDTIDKIQTYLDDLCTLMPDDQTSNNWRGIFRRMQNILLEHANQAGIDKTSEIWFSIHGGMGSWNDYYIPHEDQNKMRELNTELEQICSRISALLPYLS